MPFTGNKGYSVQAAGSNSGVWGAGNPGSDLNTGVMGILDLNMAGVVSYSLSSSNFAVSANDVQNAMLRFSGTLLASVVGTVAGGALFNGFYYWENLTTGAFSITITATGGSAVLPQGRRGILFVDGPNGPRLVAVVGSSAAQIVPAGTKQPFYQPTIPTGWSAVALNDYGLRIVANAGTGGSTSGGVQGYSVANVADYVLQIADIPSHAHSYAAPLGNDSVPVGGGGGTRADNPQTQTTGSTGGGGAHRHAATSNIQTADFVVGTLN